MHIKPLAGAFLRLKQNVGTQHKTHAMSKSRDGILTGPETRKGPPGIPDGPLLMDPMRRS